MQGAMRKHDSGPLYLTPIAGPDRAPIALTPPGPIRIGRRSTSDAHLPHELVSRDHAEVLHRAASTVIEGAPQIGVWMLRDLSSKHGTRVNGDRLPAGQPFPLREGDQIRIDPWTFRVTSRLSALSAAAGTRTSTLEDSRSVALRTLSAGERANLSARRLDALLVLSDALHGARDTAKLANLLVRAAVEGGGFENAAFVVRLSDEGEADVLASAGAGMIRAGSPTLSRSLLQAAWSGEAAALEGERSGSIGQSIMRLGVTQALAAPLVVDGAVAGCLYVDSRRSKSGAGDAQEFILGLSRVGALALSNLRRLEIEREHARLEADLEAAGEANRWIHPPAAGEIARAQYAAASRPGRTTLGGDFFDVIALPDGAVAIALGDVVGKGVAASVVMTAGQAFLHASLMRHGEPDAAVADLNRYLHPRLRQGRFVTLWVGVLQPASGALRYVDAGHGYAAMLAADAVSPLREGGALPVGVDPDAAYHAAETSAGAAAALLVVSDGVVEQPGCGVERERFGFDRAVESVIEAKSPSLGVEALFSALERYAGGPALADDATCVFVRW